MNAHELRRPTRAEELANTVTHGIGVLLAIVATALLVSQAAATGEARRVVSFAVFGITMIVLYTASSVYHGHSNPQRRLQLKMFDHISIYYLIAGTYTPVALVGLGGAWGWAIFGVIWALALAGTVFKAFFADRFPRISTIFYVAMGWTALVAVMPLVRTLSASALVWLLAGGIAYTGGVGFYVWRRLPYNHAIWHLFVLAGTGCHVAAVAQL